MATSLCTWSGSTARWEKRRGRRLELDTGSQDEAKRGRFRDGIYWIRVYCLHRHNLAVRYDLRPWFEKQEKVRHTQIHEKAVIV